MKMSGVCVEFGVTFASLCFYLTGEGKTAPRLFVMI
jgi:hypothetical protein